MINIAIVEDKDSEAKLLQDCLYKYQLEFNEKLNLKRFYDAESFLNNYHNGSFDIVFMDIELPKLNGMDAASKLRTFDKQLVLIFVTNMAQYASKGYSVDALDYILKPVNYEEITFKFQKALGIVKNNEEILLTVAISSGLTRISSKELYYIEVAGHKLTYHLATSVINSHGSLSDLEQNLKSIYFMRCNSCYLVNPKYIRTVEGFNVIMRNGDELKISQPKKKKFLDELTDWLGQGNFA